MKQTINIDLNSMIIGALACALVFVSLGNSPEPAARKITEYKVVGGGVWGTQLTQNVNEAISNKWQPLGGVSSSPNANKIQAMVKYE